jgi:RNA polymerase sigma-70 factor (ECF subfamily)
MADAPLGARRRTLAGNIRMTDRKMQPPGNLCIIIGEDRLRSSAMADDALECDLESRPQTVDDDQTLVSAAQRDTEAAGRLYDKYYREVLGYVYHCTLDYAATEDLTSNVFLAAFRHLGRFRWRQIPFRAWLYRIAINEVRMYYRRRKGAGNADRQVPYEGSAPAADEGPAAAEEYRLLHEALQELRFKYRTVIVLRYFEGKTMAQIAEITGAREGTVKSQLHRGLIQLQEILMHRGVLPQ